MRVLCVAEKPSIAKSITTILSGGTWDTVSTRLVPRAQVTELTHLFQRESGHPYIRNYDFPYKLPPPLGRNTLVEFTVTAVLGHLTTVVSCLGRTLEVYTAHWAVQDFDEDHRKWHSCDPFALFDAPVLTYVDTVCRAISHLRTYSVLNVPQKLKSVEKNLQREARNSDILMIWTDCDREGEHIGSEVVAACRKVNRNIVVKRARFSAIIAA
jgi:DNA topoisomerase-3